MSASTGTASAAVGPPSAAGGLLAPASAAIAASRARNCCSAARARAASVASAAAFVRASLAIPFCACSRRAVSAASAASLASRSAAAAATAAVCLRSIDRALFRCHPPQASAARSTQAHSGTRRSSAPSGLSSDRTAPTSGHAVAALHPAAIEHDSADKHQQRPWPRGRRDADQIDGKRLDRADWLGDRLRIAPQLGDGA